MTRAADARLRLLWSCNACRAASNLTGEKATVALKKVEAVLTGLSSSGTNVLVLNGGTDALGFFCLKDCEQLAQ